MNDASILTPTRTPTPAQLVSIVEHAPDGIFVADLHGRIEYMNETGCRMLGFARAEIIGRTIFELLATHDADSLLRAKSQMLRGATHVAEWSLRCKDGHWLRAEVSEVILPDGEWHAIVRRVANREVRVARRDERVVPPPDTEQLRVAVRDREDTLAIVTHDLRNPIAVITAIASTLDRMTRSLPDSAQIHELTEKLRATAIGMSGLVEDLLAITINQHGRSILKRTAVAPSELLDKAATAVRPLLAPTSLALVVQARADLPAVSADAERILRVFANLLDNAQKHTRAPGRILMTAESTAGGGVRFSIANSGEPLPAEALDAMFEPFWQASRDDPSGAGLGLSICRAIVEAHGGGMWAEPARGERVRVCFVLPRGD